MNKLCISPYIGAKVKLVDAINEELVYRGIDEYYELFGGMGNVLINKPPHAVEIYNDFNPKIAHLMYVLSKEGQWLLQEMLRTDYSQEAFDEALSISNSFGGIPAEQDDVTKEDIEISKATWLTLLQSRNGMMKDWREISKGNEKVMYLDKLIKKNEIPNRLKGVGVKNMDALELLKQIKYKESAMVYLDPPYVFSQRSCENLYEHDMPNPKQIEFVDLIKDAKAKVIISGYKNPIYDDVLNENSGWVSYPLMRVIKSSSSNEFKPRVDEYIWRNY